MAIRQATFVLAMPVFSAACALHIKTDQGDSCCAEFSCEMHGLIAAIPAAVDRVRFGIVAWTGPMPNPVRAVFLPSLLADAPHLARDVAENLRAVDFPESEIGSIENIGPGRELKRRIDDDKLSAPSAEVYLFFRERGARRCDDDRRRRPPAGRSSEESSS